MATGIKAKRLKAAAITTTRDLPKTPSGIQGLDEITGAGCRVADRRWSAAAPAAGRPCSPWSSSCAARPNTASQGFHGIRGDRGRSRRQCDLARLRRQQAGCAEEVGHRLCARRAQRDRGERRVRSGRSVRPARTRYQEHRRQARGSRHCGIAVRWVAEPGGAALRAAPDVSLAKRSRHDGSGDGRKGRRDAYPPGPRGIRFGLRDFSRPPAWSRP